MRCADCKKEVNTKPTRRGLERLPRGWKKHQSITRCGDCWGKKYILRAITIPIAFPLERSNKELWETLSRCWAEARCVANFQLNEMAKEDAVRTPDMEKLPPLGKVYRYNEAAEYGPSIQSTSRASLLQSVEAKYRKKRREIVWTGESTLPVHRYPLPYPIHNQAWKIVQDDGGRKHIHCRIAGEPWVLVLAGGPGFRRGHARAAELISGAAIAGELSLYRQVANPGDGSPTQNGREHGNRKRWRIMAKMVAWLPRHEVNREQKGTLFVRTDASHFWVAHHDERDQPWILNADHVRTWSVGHAKFLQRLAEDTKPDKRFPKSVRRYTRAEYDRHCRKYRMRTKTFIWQAVSALAEYCRRQNLAEIVYRDHERGYLPQWSWAEMREALACRCDELGIGFRLASGEVVERVEPEEDDTNIEPSEASGD